MTSASVFIGTTVLLSILWIWAQSRVAYKEFEDEASQRSWIFRSLFVLAIIIAFPLLVGESEVLRQFDRFPPPIMLFFFYIIGMAFFLAFSKFGTLLKKHTPLWALVGFQSFRILAELGIFIGLREGLAPVQLSIEGFNFDIITGVTAVFMSAYLYKRQNLTLAFLWNCMGVVFLIVIAIIAMTSMPIPIRLFFEEPSNVWVTKSPHILLPGVLVLAAWVGHLVAFRRIWSLRQSQIGYY